MGQIQHVSKQPNLKSIKCYIDAEHSSETTESTKNLQGGRHRREDFIVMVNRGDAKRAAKKNMWEKAWK